MSTLLHCFIAFLSSAGYASASHTLYLCHKPVKYKYKITNSLFINAALIVSFSYLWAYMHIYTLCNLYCLFTH